ncbi:MAG: hypothetical protein Q8K70_09455 [Bacteroidota bacterium]|nr:hypothetical protein [Bacteroidota bacterium]
MNLKPSFTEKQRFNQWWLKLILFACLGIFLFGLVQQLVFNIPFGNNPVSNSFLIILCLLFALLIWGMLSLNMITEINENGITVKFFPFIKKETIAWNTITQCFVRTYLPIKEYGGWGYRQSFSNGKAYNVSGNQGLQLEINGKKKLLIGTQKSEEIQKVINQYFK